ncbi:hybrid sensor histidine kinase/response regulator [Candidatus Bathyarchaeota archaeon]|nr:hybrid sensor histidine kinase/response regulator [Candidatus Bathyarchaeota archaeon]
MLIEDNPGDARVIQEMLTEEEFALDGLECFGRLSMGLNRLAQGGIDAILLDLGLPDSQGLNTFEKTYAVAPKVPILILTSNDDKSLALDAVRSGAQDYLVKGKTDGALLIRAIYYAVERKKGEEKLRESRGKIEVVAEKLRVVGELTRHDVQNKLSAVTGNAYLLKEKHADQADIVEGLGEMEMAVKDSMKIFEFAKMYEQIGVEELTYIDVEKRVNEAIALFSGFNLKVVNDCQNLSLLADSFLRQLFYNFIGNTRKYGKKTTTIRVHYEKAESGELRLFYEDDGVGISAKDKLRLFTEGFSTGGSTGFGLFLIKKMMEVYGWEIQETGEPGKGAKFTITIPKLSKNGKMSFQIAP